MQKATTLASNAGVMTTRKTAAQNCFCSGPQPLHNAPPLSCHYSEALDNYKLNGGKLINLLYSGSLVQKWKGISFYSTIF